MCGQIKFAILITITLVFGNSQGRSEGNKGRKDIENTDCNFLICIKCFHETPGGEYVNILGEVEVKWDHGLFENFA